MQRWILHPSCFSQQIPVPAEECPALPSRDFSQESSVEVSICHQDGLQGYVIYWVNFSDTDTKFQTADQRKVRAGVTMWSIRQRWDTPFPWHQQEALHSSPIADQWMIPHLPQRSPGACWEMTSLSWNYSSKYSWGHQWQKDPQNLAATG